MENMDCSGGMDTSGLNEDTFGMGSSSNVSRGEGIDAYAASWSGEGSYHVQGYENVEPEPMHKEGRGLEIATLIFGILALVICCCNGLFAVIGLVLGIVAVAKGKKSGMTIAGIVCSVLGLFFSIIILLFSFSDVGKEFRDAFMEGYESATEEYVEEPSTVEEEHTQESVKSHEGTEVVSDEIAGKVVIDGKEIYIPCKLSEMLDLYEVSEYSKEDVNGGLGSYESKSIFFSEDGRENGVFVDVQNYTEEELDDIKNAYVGMISLDDDLGKQVEVFGGLTLGMSETQVEECLRDYKYNKSEMSGYVFYNVFAGEDSDYSISLMLSEDVVINITLYYSGL